ncbi:TonB-dependent receptor [Persicobacter diffluens]|uniref:TonB-dependent receptor n=1 Tax=Persicobacter diffluens TaxID=981 RepID=A0AAN5AM00_9BACT|nr:TonB-dependent receptor [Persicobacter diffluens]
MTPIKNQSYKLLLLLPLVICETFLPLSTKAQNTHQARVIDEKGIGVSFASILIEPSGEILLSDENGYFTFHKPPKGSLTFTVSHLSFIAFEKSINVSSLENQLLPIKLQPKNIELDQVIIRGKSEATQLREAAYAIEVIEAESFKKSSVDVNQILGRISGVNIRENGGLGSSFNLSLNGLSGNRVRTFINGVPMDYFGNSLTLNNFPANQIEAIEVYKGAVPIHLSSDALGGAVNISLKQQPITFLDASYSVGSFNTHKAAVNGQWHHPKSGLTFRLKSFYNQSDNDYKVNVHLLDYETGKLAEESTTVRRFHDAYQSNMVWAEAGFQNKSFADELMFGFLHSANHNEFQQSPYATGISAFPTGEAFSKTQSKIGNLSYRKKGLLTKRLNVAGYVVYVSGQDQMVDISPHRYDWFGNYEPNVHPTTGEMGRKTNFQLNRENWLGNFNTEYSLGEHHGLAFNYSLNQLSVQGEDEFQPQNNTQFSEPNEVRKDVLGLSYSVKALHDKWKTNVFGKKYLYELNAVEASYDGSSSEKVKIFKQNNGLGIASTYVFDDIQLKASFEKAYRFPEYYELFGDGLNVIPNQNLQAEESQNYNLGFRLNKLGTHRIRAELNTFMRDTKNYIRFEPRMNRSRYINDEAVLAQGLDLTLNYAYDNTLNVNFSGTYQSLKNNDKASALYQDRIPNEPYLFGNLSLIYQLPLDDRNELSFATTHRYVHEFYFQWPSIASQDSKAVIPSQLTHNIELTYVRKKGRLSFSFLIANIMDAEVFDNLNQPKPGRAYSLKSRIYLQKNQ